MTPSVRKAVILTAGLGTRFLPMTKAIPKAMLPIVDRPVVQHLVEEAIASGITEILIVRSPSQEVIEDHFKPDPVFEEELKARGKLKALEKVRAIGKGAKISFAIQVHALGDGHALLHAKDFIGDEPFAVLFGDDIIKGPDPALKQLLNVYEQTKSSVICAKTAPTKDLHLYGVIEENNGKVTGLVEKPKPGTASSNLIVIGKYVCTNDVLKALETAEAGHEDQELRLIDAFITLLEKGDPIHTLEVEGARYDTGKPEGLLQANVELAK